MSRARLKAALLFIAGALVATIIFDVMLVATSNDQVQQLKLSYARGFEDAKEQYSLVASDTPIAEGNHMPLWLQTDPQWSYITYANGTIGDSGCGLTVAAMAIKYMTLQDITPLALADAIGDECLTAGVNDPGKFCAWIAEHYSSYNIEYSSIYYQTSDALDAVDDGWLVFAGLSGEFGDSDYGGHVVMIWRSDDAGYWVRDPASAGNSSRAWSREELEAAGFNYFYSIKGGYYGA